MENKNLSDLQKEELMNICYAMSYGDDSEKTFDRFCELMGMKLSDEEKQRLREETFEEDLAKQCEQMGHMFTWMPKNQSFCMRCGKLLSNDNTRGFMENCPKCGVRLNERTAVHNIPSNCINKLTFPYMKLGESMHLECYIEQVIGAILQEKLKDLFRRIVIE